MQTTAGRGFYPRYVSILRRVIMVLAVVAGLAVASMIVVTCIDVVGRRFGRPLEGDL
jgi:hypothetical protein